jgi:hypothetical protein
MVHNNMKRNEKLPLPKFLDRVHEARRHCKAAIDFYADLIRKVDEGTFHKDHCGHVIGAISAGDDGTVKVHEISGWRREDKPKP